MSLTKNIDNLIGSLNYDQQSKLFNFLYEGKTLNEIFTENLLQLDESILNNIKLNILPKVGFVGAIKELRWVKFSELTLVSCTDGIPLSFIYFFGKNGAVLKNDANVISNLY